MKKEELIKGRKYVCGKETFTFEKFNHMGNPSFLKGDHDYLADNEGFIGFVLNHVLDDFKPVLTYTVHVVYYPHGEDLISRGENVTGIDFIDCIKQFEAMNLGSIFNVTVK